MIESEELKSYPNWPFLTTTKPPEPTIIHAISNGNTLTITLNGVTIQTYQADEIYLTETRSLQ